MAAAARRDVLALPEIKQKLHALSRVSGTPQWRVVSAALERFFHQHSPANQRLAPRRMARRADRPAAGVSTLMMVRCA